jgi:hypothetical protein
MRKFLAGLLLLALSASTGCFVEVDGVPRHRHCYGCGHVYIKGTWR